MILAGFNVDNGSTTISGNANQPRAWRFQVANSGNAGKLVFKAGATTTYKFAIYYMASAGAVPTTRLDYTVDVVATIGTVYEVPLPAQAPLTAGSYIAVASKFAAGGTFFKGNTGTNTIYTSSTDASFAVSMDDPWSNTGASTSSVPYLYIESTEVSITNIDKIESGSTSSITLSDSSFAATNVKITNDSLTKTITTSGTAPNFNFIAPSWVDGETVLLYGACSVVANDGTNDTTAFTSTPITVAAPLAVVTLTSVSANSLDKIASFSPAWKIGTQVVYDATKGTVYANGEYDDLIFDGEFWVSSGFEGTTQIWDRDPDDKIARVSNVTLNDGGVVPSTGGLTSSGLTSSGLTRTGLTSSGL